MSMLLIFVLVFIVMLIHFTVGLIKMEGECLIKTTESEKEVKKETENTGEDSLREVLRKQEIVLIELMLILLVMLIYPTIELIKMGL